MKTVKWIDVGISFVLIIFFTVYYYFTDKKGIGNLNRLILAYFIIGAYQTGSMIVHALNRWFTPKWSIRYVYHWVSLLCWITLPIGAAWILFFTAPFMAVFYTLLCFKECRKISERPLSVLK